HHTTNRLYYGVCANDATQTIAELTIKFFQEHGRVPAKDDIVQMYYGEHIDSVDIFLSFNQFSAYDMPLLATGNEDLYFTVSPSPYLTAGQLRAIIYDHLYARRDDNDVDYDTFTAEDWEELRTFYTANRGNTMGIGTRHPKMGFWYPLPQ